ncbi:unnamed protein product [Rotaria sp. Silwood2]|nr:unnamed protein product [Rotaria sp. Silwood2]CAF4561283.1 unnamed protein product [Rotaria sp. Silwood2]
MMVNTFELLPVDVIFEIFSYLSAVEILQSFLSLNNYLSSIIMYEYLWHIHIGGNRISLSTFNNLCQNGTSEYLFLRSDELYISGDHQCNECFTELGNCGSSLSSLVPRSLLKQITIDWSYSVNAAQLEAILRLAYNVDALVLIDDIGLLTRMILHNTDQVGIHVNQQIRSLRTINEALKMVNIQCFCESFCRRLPNLEELSFSIAKSGHTGTWIPSHSVDDENKSIKRFVNAIHFLVNHLQQLISLHISFHYRVSSETPCFSHLLRRQLHEWSLSRPYRLQCFPNGFKSGFNITLSMLEHSPIVNSFNIVIHDEINKIQTPFHFITS